MGYWYCWGGTCSWQSDSLWWVWVVISVVIAVIFGLSIFFVIRRRRMRMQAEQAAYAEAVAAQQAAGTQGWSQGGPPPAGYPTDMPYTQQQGAYAPYNGYTAQQGYPAQQQGAYPAPYTYPTYGANDSCATGTQQQPVYGYPAPMPPNGQFSNIDLTQAGAANNSGGKV